MNLYPVMLDLQDKKIVIIGGGKVALRKARGLKDTGAQVAVIAPEIEPELDDLLDSFPGSSVEKRTYREGDCKGAFLVFFAADNAEARDQVARECKSGDILCNLALGPEESDFLVPSFEHIQGCTLAVSTGGLSPALAAQIRRDLGQAIPPETNTRLQVLSILKQFLMERDETFPVEMRGHLLRNISSSDELMDQARRFVFHGDNEHLERWIRELEL